MNRFFKNLLLLAATLVGVALGACDDGDSIARDLATVEREFAVIHTRGEAPAPPASRERVYTSALPVLQNAARSGDSSQQLKANMALITAQQGLADMSAGRAAELERRLLDDTTRLRAQFDAFVSHSAAARVFESVDPSGERAELTRAIAQIDARQEEEAASAQALQARIDDLRADAERLERQADAVRRDVGELRARALDVDADEAADLSEQAFAKQREADALDVEAARIRARMEEIEPEHAQTRRLMDGLSRERTSLLDARRRVDDRASDAQTNASDARSDAQRAASEAEAILDRIERIREEELAPAWSDAIRRAEDALRNAAQLRSLDRATQSVMRADAALRAGDLHASMARGQERYLILLDALSESDPPPPFIGRVSEIRGRLVDDLMESRNAAIAHLQDALNAYQGASSRDQDVQNRLESTRRNLASILSSMGVESPESP